MTASASLRKVFHRLPDPLQNAVRRGVASVQDRRAARADGTNTTFWTTHNVTQHRRFANRAESLAYLDWRNAQYQFYEEFIPFERLGGAVVLDHGCGPGHDLVALHERSKADRIIGADISPASLGEARERLGLHGVERPELLLLDEQSARIPLADGEIDAFISSGVLHHCPNIDEILVELRRVLRPGGFGRVMVYNRDSVFFHLYVPYILQMVQGIDAGLSVEEAFQQSTDGRGCPCSIAYRPAEFVDVCNAAGFETRWIGAATASLELELLPRRFEAIREERLAAEHRDFLVHLTFDQWGRPVHNGETAGVDGFYELVKPLT